MPARTVAAVVGLASLLAMAVAGPAPAAEPPPGVKLTARGGFGDRGNSYSWSMARFKGKLYVGTARHQACVENLTIDFYLPVLEQYRTGVFPGVTCPPDPWDMDLRAEIWQYTPKTKQWRRVFRSPADIPNPAAPGRYVARDIGFRGMTVYRDARGRKALYVGGVTADELLPPLRRKHPPRLLVTTDGRNFRAVPARGTLIRNPFGTHRVIGFRSLKVWRDRLFVTLTGGLAGDGQVYEVKRPWGPKARFEQITPKRLMVFEIERFGGALYAGTGDRETGYGVYKTTSRGAPYEWTPVVRNGAGRGARITSVVSMHPYRGELYVGSSGWYNDEVPQSELIRVSRTGEWDVVVGAPRRVDRVSKFPVSGIGDGFNSIFAAHFWRMGRHDGGLYLGTNDWSWMLQLEQQWYPLYKDALSWEYGFDVWATCNGGEWFPVTRTAFNDDMAHFGARALVGTPNGLFVGSANHAQGTAVWRDRQQPCEDTGATAARGGLAAPESPRRVLADVQRDGTVVSWAGNARAERYRVLRAPQTDISLSVVAPPASPNGLRSAEQLPAPVAPGTRGSSVITGTTLGKFEPIGTTGSRYFVDRSREHGAGYAYQVIAEGTGGDSRPSGVQFVPDSRPPVTWGDVRRAAGPGSASSRIGAAAASLDRGELRRSLATLARLRRDARAGSALDGLAMRLARQIRYRDAAGGPA